MTVQELRDFSNKVKEMWEAGKIRCPVHLPGGNEHELVEVFKDIKAQDYVFSTHRNMYHYLLKGGSPDKLVAELLRQESGTCRGRSGSMNTSDHKLRFYSSAIVGGVCAIAVGVAWEVRETDTHVWCFVGDGVVDGGHFWEALVYSAGWQLPITFVIENNNRSTCTSIEERLGDKWIHSLIPTYSPSVSKRVRYYSYTATEPHVGSGKYVQF